MSQPEPVVEPVKRSTQSSYSKKSVEDAEVELALSYCPRCSTHLTARSCKLICPGCGYYMSCSDFY
jgi:ribosomal protein S27AE